MQQYEFHEVANIFPMMTDEEFRGLVEDIRVNGQIDPVWIHQNKIIDGRNRYNVCLELSIEPKVEEWDDNGDLISFVISKNLHRRQMTPSQLSMVAARIKHLFEKDAKERQISQLKKGNEIPSRPTGPIGITGRTNTLAAELVGSSPTSVKRATNVINNGSEELINAVDTGVITVNKAAEIAVLPKEIQKVAIEESKISRKEVKKENEKYIEEHAYELTDEDKEIQDKIKEINDYLTKHMADLQNKICKSETPMHLLSDIACFTGAMEKHIDSLESNLQLKIKQMEREEND